MENFADLQSICIRVFEEVSKSCSVFIVPLFIGKIVFSNITGEGSQALGLIKGLTIYFCLIAGFPVILDILFSIPESYLPKLGSFDSNHTNSEFEFTTSLIPFAVDRVLEVILAALFWVAFYLHAFFMLMMSSMAPIIFLTSTMLGIGAGIEIFFGLLIVGSCWPIIWYGFDLIHLSLATNQTDEFAAKCLAIIITLFKALSPVAFAALAIKSPAGQTMSKATRGGISSSRWLATSTPGAYRQVRERSNQVINRIQSFRTRFSQQGGQSRPASAVKASSADSRLSRAKIQSEGVGR